MEILIVCSGDWRGGEDLEKKGRRKWKKLKNLGEEGFRGFIFLDNSKPPTVGELKKCTGGGFWEV